MLLMMTMKMRIGMNDDEGNEKKTMIEKKEKIHQES
jgi:hypothetical protein